LKSEASEIEVPKKRKKKKAKYKEEENVEEPEINDWKKGE